MASKMWLLVARPVDNWKTKEKLTSRISLLAFGDVASLNSLMATGILTFSPSGIQSPCDEEGDKTLTGDRQTMQYASSRDAWTLLVTRSKRAGDLEHSSAPQGPQGLGAIHLGSTFASVFHESK